MQGREQLWPDHLRGDVGWVGPADDGLHGVDQERDRAVAGRCHQRGVVDVAPGAELAGSVVDPDFLAEGVGCVGEGEAIRREDQGVGVKPDGAVVAAFRDRVPQ